LKYGVFTGGDSGDFGFELGYRGDFVFDRKLENKINAILGPGTLKDVYGYSSTINAGQLTVNLWDRFDVYGWVGVKNSEIAKQLAFTVAGVTAPVRDLRVTTKDGLAWGVGARAVLWSSGNTAIGIDGQYADSKAKFRSYSFNGVPIQATGLLDLETLLPVDPSQFRDKSREYQVSLGISHRICWMTPYVAVKYSNFESRITGPEIGVPVVPPGGTVPVIVPFNPNNKARSRNNVGFVCGVSIVDAERMHVTAEGRFVDERALTVAADFRF
jgi:opacity protein-like surface antigen